MSITIWHKLGSTTLQPSTVALRAYDGHSIQSHRILTNVPIELVGKMVLIDIEVVNAQLD